MTIRTADSRLADYLLDLNPATTNALTNLTLGGYFSSGRIWVLHSRFRYFDPVKRRAGLPEDVGALVEKLGADSATLTLVNTNPIEAREVVVQAGGYGEHRFEAVTVGKKSLYEGAVVTVAVGSREPVRDSNSKCEGTPTGRRLRFPGIAGGIRRIRRVRKPVEPDLFN